MRSNIARLQTVSVWTFWMGAVAGAASLAISVASPLGGAVIGLGALISSLASSLAAQRQSKLVQTKADADAAALRNKIEENHEEAIAIAVAFSR